MMLRRAVFALVVIVAFAGGMILQRQLSSPRESPGSQAAEGDASGMAGLGPGGMIAEPPPDLDTGLDWTVPKRWARLADRAMRVATYSAPAASGDAEAAECAVFHFGPGQGGGVEDNIRRWVEQFENAQTPDRVTRTLNGLKVHRVQVRGDYLAPSGPMMQSSGTKQGYMLIGSIVEGPAGDVYFKLTGPERTTSAAAKEFDAMVGSVRKK